MNGRVRTLTATWLQSRGSKSRGQNRGPTCLVVTCLTSLWTHQSLGKLYVQQQSQAWPPPHREETTTAAGDSFCSHIPHPGCVCLDLQAPAYLPLSSPDLHSLGGQPLTRMTNACFDILEMFQPLVSAIMNWTQAEKRGRWRAGRRWPW